ncbi:MAG: peptidase S9 family protein [Phycisphaerae bacterium]|nr:MAG: peptidase S9 family protein [Phycisphaerae bacterium]
MTLENAYGRRMWIKVVPMVLAVGSIVLNSETSRGADVTASMSQFIKISAPGSGDLAPDGTFYFIDDPDGVYQLFSRKSLADKAKALTTFEDGISGYSLSDDGAWMVIGASIGGDEQDDLYLMDTKTEKIEPLLVDRESVFGSVVWRPDSKAFAYRANKESKNDFYVYVYDLEARESKRVLDKEGYFYPADFSPDQSRLMVGKYNSSTYSQLFEVDLNKGTAREATPTDEQCSFSPQGYLADGKSFLVGTNYHGDLRTLRMLDLATGKLSKVASEFDQHELDGVAINHERTLAAVMLNEDGYRTVHLRTLPDFKPVDGPPCKKGIVGNVRLRGSDILYRVESSNDPGVMYKWSRANPKDAPVAMTEAELQGIDLASFSLPELIRYKSFDGLEVPAFLYTPKGYKKGSSIPFIVSYHGGPESQFRPGLVRSFQYFLSRGFGVIAPNVRGSSGYGKRYLEMDNYKKRMDSVRDGVQAAQWLVDNQYSKPRMIGAYGGSYGGFMVVATITQAPKLFGAACDVVGIVNFKTFLERTKAYRRKLREVEYGPLSDPDFLESISPIRLVDRIETPILIAHGRNDPRVPVYEAEQLHEALKKRNQDSELLIFEDEGHGFRKEENRVEFYQRLADFFESKLKPVETDTTTTSG